MDNEFGPRLRELLADDRIKMLNNPSECESLLQDKTNLREEEISLLIAVLKSGISRKLKEWVWSKHDSLTAKDLEVVILELSRDGYTAEACEWALKTWATALDIPNKFGGKKKTRSGKKEGSGSSSGWLSSLKSLLGKGESLPAATADSSTDQNSSAAESDQMVASEMDGTTASEVSTEQNQRETGKKSTAINSTIASSQPDPQPTPHAEEADANKAFSEHKPEGSLPAEAPQKSEAPDLNQAPPDMEQAPQSEQPISSAADEAFQTDTSPDNKTNADPTGIEPGNGSVADNNSEQEWWEALPVNEPAVTVMDNDTNLGEKNKSAETPPPPDKGSPEYPSTENTVPTDKLHNWKENFGRVFTGKPLVKWGIAAILLLTFSLTTWVIIRPDHSPSPPPENSDQSTAQIRSLDHPRRTNDLTGDTSPIKPAKPDPRATQSVTESSTTPAQPPIIPPISDRSPLDAGLKPKPPGEETKGPAADLQSEVTPQKDRENTPTADKETTPSVQIRRHPEDSLTKEEIIADLRASRTTAEFLTKLGTYKNNQLLGFGQKDNFGSVEGCYIFIFDKQEIKETYQIRNGRFHTLSTGEEYAEIAASLSPHERLIWVQMAQ